MKLFFPVWVALLLAATTSFGAVKHCKACESSKNVVCKVCLRYPIKPTECSEHCAARFLAFASVDQLTNVFGFSPAIAGLVISTKNRASFHSLRDWEPYIGSGAVEDLSTKFSSLRPNEAGLFVDVVTNPRHESKDAVDLGMFRNQLFANQQGMNNVSPSEGAYLAGLIAQIKGKRALEIGPANGYSATWLAPVLRSNGGRLVTLEIDRATHELAVRNLELGGLDDVVEARRGDALKEVPEIQGPLDFVFIDANPKDHRSYLRMVVPKVHSGGIIVTRGPDEEIRELAGRDPALTSETVKVGNGGFVVFHKR